VGRDDGAGARVRYNGGMTNSHFGCRTITQTLPAFTPVKLHVDFRIDRLSPRRAARAGIRAAL
jgi:hypothetical protein